MTLGKRWEVEVIELSCTSTQGWLYSNKVAEALSQGWRVIGVSCPGNDRMNVLVTRTRWFFNWCD